MSHLEPNFRWELPKPEPDRTAALSAFLHCPTAIAQILANRGITDPEPFFHPTLALLYDPNLLLGLPQAVARIERALAHDEPILIYGDYDVDGTTATVLLKTAIERVAPPDHPARVTYHVPHRIREGYGMQTKVLGEVAEGLPNRTIAAVLGCSERTVEVHLTAIFEKAQVESRAALIAAAFKLR